MGLQFKTKKDRRKIRIRKKIFGTAQRPRLSVYRSLNQIYAQIIDDKSRRTLITVSSLSKEIEEEIKKSNGKVEKSILVGELLAKKASQLGIKTVVFDRNGYLYHGRVKGVAEGARKGGLKI